MDCKLIAMDLDGTLNNDEKRITEKTLDALMEAQKRGIRLALASARPLPGLYKERDILQLQGRLQSRIYTKVTDSGSEERTAYEISALTAQIQNDEIC